MAVKLEKGNIYTAEMVRNGVSSRGDWEMVKVADKKKQITIWPDNRPSGVTEGGEFELVEITGVTYGARKFKEQWMDDVSITGVLKPTSTKSMDFDADDFGENPFLADTDFGSDGLDGELPF